MGRKYSCEQITLYVHCDKIDSLTDIHSNKTESQLWPVYTGIQLVNP